MTRPLIGLSGQRHLGREIVGNLEVLADSDLDVFYADYSRAVLAAGGIPLFIPLDLDPADVVDRLDGLLLTGGSDIAPERYGAAHEATTHAPDAKRDGHELTLLDLATEKSLPTLGICRGLQMMNVHGGGTLSQHVPEHAALDLPPTTELHQVHIEPDSVLQTLYGPSKAVNSLHHQSVDAVAAGYTVTGTAEDGGVEAIEHTELPFLAVQWHPEMMLTSETDPVFAWLIDTAMMRRKRLIETAS